MLAGQSEKPGPSVVPLLSIFSFFAIRSRLMILMLGAVAPLMTLLVFDANSARRLALDQASTSIELRARFAAERLSRIFDRASVILADFGSLPSVEAINEPPCRDAAAAFVARHREFRTVGVVDPNGDIVCHNSMSDRRAFTDLNLVSAVRTAPVGELRVGRLMVGNVTGKRTIIVAMRMEAAPGSQPPVMFASIDLSGFSEAAELAIEDDIATAVVVDGASGEVFAGGGVGRTLVGGSVGDALVAAMQPQEPSKAAWMPLFGEEQVIGFAPLRIQGLSRPMMVLSAPRADILDAANQRAFRRLIIAAGVTLFALCATWMMAVAAFAKPIRRLTAAAAWIGAGNLEARVKIDAWQAQELRTLGGALNDMATKLGAAREQLEGLANQDGLTGLANRRRFDAAIDVECRHAEREGTPMSLLLIDIDFFKSFNDKAGHVAGDHCLRIVGEALKGCATRPNDVAARYGGEEFAIILPNTNGASALAVASNVHKAIRQAAIRRPESDAGLLTVSIGIVSIESKSVGLTPNAVIALADEALYAAKLEGRNRSQATGWQNRQNYGDVSRSVTAA